MTNFHIANAKLQSVRRGNSPFSVLVQYDQYLADRLVDDQDLEQQRRIDLFWFDQDDRDWEDWDGYNYPDDIWDDGDWDDDDWDPVDNTVKDDWSDDYEEDDHDNIDVWDDYYYENREDRDPYPRELKVVADQDDEAYGAWEVLSVIIDEEDNDYWDNLIFDESPDGLWSS